VRRRLSCSLTTLPHRKSGKTILVPLTNSLYVPGKLSDPDHVIVDIGTGYYVQKVREYLYGNSTPELKAHLCDVDASSSCETLRGQDRVYPNKCRHTRRNHSEEEGQHELSDWDSAAEDPDGDTGRTQRKDLIELLFGLQKVRVLLFIVRYRADFTPFKAAQCSSLSNKFI
jgi:hypothetical protein